MTQHVIRVPKPVVQESHLGFFRFGRLSDDLVVLTNDVGEWLTLSDAEFKDFLAGNVDAEHPKHPDMQRLGFLRDGADLDALADRLRRKKSYVSQGPHLHVLVTTLRCNQTCRYCHASRRDMGKTGFDMTVANARKAVDHAFETPSPYLCFEFQGGEPTANMDVVKDVVAYAKEKNLTVGKELDLSLVTNFTLMDEEKAQWIVDNGLYVCTSLDGPKDVHDDNRLWLPKTSGTSAYEQVMHWMKWFNARYIDKGLDPNLWHVDALLTTTRKTLTRGRDCVDLYVDLGIRSLHLRPLNPYGFAKGSWKRIGYELDEFLAYYEDTLDYIIALNREGVEICEGTAALILTKLLSEDDPNYVDLRSPCGAGIGQVAYDPNGRIFPCDEARMLAASGDENFVLGQVGETTMSDTLSHPTVRSMFFASLQESLPGCSTCWNQPYCGVCPIHDYSSQGTMFGQRAKSRLCQQYLALSTMLMRRLAADDDGSLLRIFRRWTQRRPRENTSCAV
jgi:uncharacterized protein